MVLSHFKNQNMLFDHHPEDQNLSKLAIFGDGGSRGNPGKSACGFVIYDISFLNFDQCLTSLDQFIISQAKIIYQEGIYLGIATNNVAEWNSVALGLEYIVKNFPQYQDLIIFMDSDLVVKQIKGIYKIKQPNLIPLGKKVKELLKKFNSFEIFHIYREYNKIADQMVNECLDNL